MAKVRMEMDKNTKTTIRFKEILANELDAPVIGQVYIPKATLKQIGWEEGKEITLDVDVQEAAPAKRTRKTTARTTKAKTVRKTAKTA